MDKKEIKAIDKGINFERKKWHSDFLTASVNSIIHMYKDKELFLDAPYQRELCWTLKQKSNLIESIILRIPIPMFFVTQEESGVWEVLDGLQRISTILNFVGLLKDKNGNTKKKFLLEGLERLNFLNGKCWDDFPSNLKTEFKLSGRIGFTILSKEVKMKDKIMFYNRLNFSGNPHKEEERAKLVK